MSLGKLIDLDRLSRYNDKVNNREDEKINSVPFANSMEYVKWYFDVHRDGKVYGVKFAYTSAGVIVPTGTKYGANVGLVVQPSTRTVSGRNDYENITVFKHFEANAHVDDNGNTIIDAIRGDKNFSYTGKVDVVCVFAPVYEKVYTGMEGTTKYLYIEWCDTPRPGFTLNKLCKDGNGNNKGFYCITKFQAGLIDGVPYASADLRPWTNGPSHNNCVTYYHKKSIYASAMTMAEWAMLQRIFMMKFASTDSQTHLNGLTNYLPTMFYWIQFAVTNKNYIVLTTANADILDVNTRIDIGTSGSRGNANFTIGCNLEILSKSSDIVIFNAVTDNITATGYVITSINNNIMCVKSLTGINTQDVEGNPITFTYTVDGDETGTEYNGVVQLVVSDSTYLLELYDDSGANKIGDCSVSGIVNCTILYLDDEVTTLTSHRVCTSVYTSGYSSEILGEDGCYMVGEFTSSSRHPCVLSGIEFLTGAYDIIGNAVWQYDSDTLRHTLIMNDPSKLTTTTETITSTYTDIGVCADNATTNSWYYNNDIHYDLNNGGLIMDSKGASSTTGLCDTTYILGNQTSGLYEVLVFSSLFYGALYGLFYADASGALSASTWSIASRPSLNGVMG